MSIPRVRKRLRSLRPATMKRRKVSQETVVSSASSQPQQVATVPSTTQSASSSVKGQVIETVVTQDSSPDEPSRPRNIVPQWLDKQVQRLQRLRRGYFWHRDSMFEKQDVKQEPTQTAQDADAAVSEPHSEPVSPRVIDHFFTLYPAGGSDWRNSARWKRHLAKCSVTRCSICEATRRLIEVSPSPVRPSAKLPASLPTNSSARSPTGSLPKCSKDSFFSIPLWRSSSSRKRQKRGKSRAQDELDEDIEPLSPGTQVPQYLETPSSRRNRTSRPGIIIRDGCPQFAQRALPPPVRCSSISKPLDASKIPVPEAPQLRLSSATINMGDLSEITARPYEISPLELLRFPLSKHYNLPSTPHLKPKQVAASVPEMEPLTGASRVSSVDSLMSSVNSLLSESSTVGPNPTNVQRWPSRPPSVPSPNMAGYTIADLLSQDGYHEMPTLWRPRAAAGASAHRTRGPRHLPKPPQSRHTSNAWRAVPTHPSPSSRVSRPANPIATPEGSANRNGATCELFDTTESSLPNHPAYVNARARLDRHWAGWAERRGPGMRKWR